MSVSLKTHHLLTAMGLLASLILISFGVTFAQTASAGQANIAEGSVAARFKSFGNTGSREIYVGLENLATSTTRLRAEVDAQWASGSNQITYAYDPLTDTLTATISQRQRHFCSDFLQCRGRPYDPRSPAALGIQCDADRHC